MMHACDDYKNESNDYQNRRVYLLYGITIRVPINKSQTNTEIITRSILIRFVRFYSCTKIHLNIIRQLAHLLHCLMLVVHLQGNERGDAER